MSEATQSTRQDVYQRVTDAIVAQLEQGVRPWNKPWKGDNAEGRIQRPLNFEGKPYRGINVMMLWMTAMERGYSSSTWMTFNQAKKFGACVRKGEKGTLVVFANVNTRTKTNAETGEEEEKKSFFMTGYTVFNVEQIDGLPSKYSTPVEVVIDPVERMDHAEAFFANTGAVVKHGGNRAYYSPHNDFVQMPPFECFENREAYYGTLAHELSHWTGHKSRLDREVGRRFGDDSYAMEELVAELSSAFLSADLGLTPDIRDEHASYLATWLKVLKADNRAIFTASSQAQKAADYLHSLQPAGNAKVEEVEELAEAA